MSGKRGILFDLDGVLTDTARYHYLAWKRLAGELGLAFSQEDNERLKGVDRLRSLEIMLELNGMSGAGCFPPAKKQAAIARKNVYYRELIRQITPGDILPGIPEFLEELRAGGFRTAVASASKNAPDVLERLGLAERFDYVADACAIAKAKPDPEVVLVCAEALGLKPEACIGIEDSQAGVEAIHRAAMFSVGIHVRVTSIPPDLPLGSTGELKLERILGAAAQWSKHAGYGEET